MYCGRIDVECWGGKNLCVYAFGVVIVIIVQEKKKHTEGSKHLGRA